MREVGVALALRRQKKLLASEEGPMQKNSKDKKPKAARKAGGKTKTNGPAKPSRNASWEILLEGSALYFICLILPNILRIIVRWYRQCWEENGVLRQALDSACSYSWIANTVLHRACRASTGNLNGNDPKATSASFTDAMAPDAGISDLAIVVFLSISMAVIRVALVHILVPRYLEQPQRLEALVRCKSVHLLSSQYPGTVTPRSSIRKTVVLDEKAVGLQQLQLPFLGGSGGGGGGSILKSVDGPTLLLNSFQRPSLVQGEYKTNGGDSDGDDWLLLDSDERGAQEEYIAPPLAVSSGLLTSSSALSLQALLQQATATGPPLDGSSSGSKNGDATPPTMERLFAAPKYATAVFRLMYTVMCITIALYYFSDADFWPPAVGGRGDTKNCWDLSSVGAAVMDSDFDQHNSVLRRYFLVQASYHIHSGAFHIVASLLLWFVSSSRNRKSGKPHSAPKKVLGFLPPGMLTVINIQQFFQHCFAVVLIAGTYLFSSMRRLAAVGMFAFDVSSLFLHLLQLCINAPPNLLRSSPTWVWILYRGLVIPSFCYSRFYVFPFVLGYSAIFESQDWLRQLENMSEPGLAKAMQLIFVVWLCLLMAMNIIYIKRLLYHPHVLRALNKEP